MGKFGESLENSLALVLSLFEFCMLCGTSIKNRREADSHWLALRHLRVVTVHWLRTASCQHRLILLGFVLCLFAEPEAAGRGTSWTAWAREGHWLCCSHLHGPAGPDHPRCVPGALGQCCWQHGHCDFSIDSGTDRLLLCCFLCTLCGVGPCEVIGRKLPRAAFSFWVSSTLVLLLCWYCCTSFSLTSLEQLQFQSFTKWRLDKTGCLLPQI